MSYTGRRWHLRMGPRDTDEGHRASTTLELLFDLVFVVAIARVASSLEHEIAEGRYGYGALHFAMVFFAIWWAWMNFSWFASAYDVDDVPYRLLTLVEMAGSLVIAAGVTTAFVDDDYTVVVAGYVLMRLAMICQWLRAAAGDPPRRRTALRYAVGIGVVQIGWIAMLAVPAGWRVPMYVALMAAELSVPPLAERNAVTPWHPGHIAERYGLFTIIVLGESIGAVILSIQEAADEHGGDARLYGIGACGLVIVFCMWWVYFDRDGESVLRGWSSAIGWGYGHLVIFAGAAAVGAGLQTAVTAVGPDAEVHENVVGAAIALPVAAFVAGVWALHVAAIRSRSTSVAYGVAVVALLAAVPAPATIVVVAGVLAALVAVIAATGHRAAVSAER